MKMWKCARIQPALWTVLLPCVLVVAGNASAGTKNADKKKNAPKPAPLTDVERLGKKLFFDATLSSPNGQSCSSCHSPEHGFTDPDQSVPTSQGVLPRRFGFRNAPSVAYASYTTPFQYNSEEGSYQGGTFWDGRVDDLVEQAQQPFLNQLEMHNANESQVVAAVRQGEYASLFIKVYGKGALNKANDDAAYVQIAEALAAYEASSEVNQFSSKFDYYLQGKATLTAKEQQGMTLFNGKANCSTCHISKVVGDEPGPLFTDHTFDNIGVPRNPENPYYTLPASLNPDGANFIDVGLANTVAVLDPVHAPDFAGMFQFPTLRNVALSAPYSHNGYFKTLKDIVHFYNTRDVPSAGWPAAEIPETMNTKDLGNLGLTDAEEDAIVAFLETLTDGYQP
jgi:cytochrome c peroxidase